MFSIAEPRDLVGLLRATLLDVSAEVVVFGVEPGPDRLHHLADDSHQRIADYEAKTNSLQDTPAFLAAMRYLTGTGI